MTKKKEERMYEQDCKCAEKVLNSLKADEVERPARVLAIALGIGLGVINNTNYSLEMLRMVDDVSRAMHEALEEEEDANDGQ